MDSLEPTPREFGIPNIGPRQRRRRIRIAIAALIIGAGLNALLTATDAGLLLRLLIFGPFWAAMLAALEARRKTCVILAARGLSNLDKGDEAVTDAEVLRQMRRQARDVHVRALLFAALLTIIVLAVTR